MAILVQSNKKPSVTFPSQKGGGASFDKVLEAGRISTTAGNGSYLTETFEDISSYKTVIVKVYDTVSDIEYIDYIAVNPAIISTYRDFTAWLHPGGGNINVRITTTTITCTSYSGSWHNIFVDIIATNEDIFTYLGSGGGKEILFDGSSSTSQWNEPIVIEKDCSAFDILDITAVQDSDISQPIRVADIPQNSSPSSIRDYLRIATKVYVRLNDSGYLYIYVDSNFTLTVTKLIGYK